MTSKFTTWRNMLRDFLRDCEKSSAEDQAERIREAMMLASFSANRPPQRNDPQIEEMLAAGAFESATIALLPSGTGFSVSRSSGGGNLATVRLPGAGTEIAAAGQTLALSILQAHASALLEQGDELAHAP